MSYECFFGMDCDRCVSLDGWTDVGQVIGEGAQGAVYLLRHDTTRQRGALKISCRPAEVEYMQRMSAAGIGPKVYSVERCDGKPVDRQDDTADDRVFEDVHYHVVMEFIEGGDLSDRAATPELISKSLQAYWEATKHQVFQNDLTTNNLLMTADDRVVLSDYGCATNRILEPQGTLQHHMRCRVLTLFDSFFYDGDGDWHWGSMDPVDKYALLLECYHAAVRWLWTNDLDAQHIVNTTGLYAALAQDYGDCRAAQELGRIQMSIWCV